MTDKVDAAALALRARVPPGLLSSATSGDAATNLISRKMSRSLAVPPRLIRFRDAPSYLGMDRNRFNAEVRPELTQIPIGTQGIAFDRLELDAWVDQYKNRNGRPAQRKGTLTWDERESPDSSTGAVSGTSTSASEVDAFAKALAKATSQRRRST